LRDQTAANPRQHTAPEARNARASPEGQATVADIPNYATGGAVALDYELRAG